MGQANELARALMSEWMDIRKSLNVFADQIYSMDANERGLRINDFLKLLQDLVNIFYHLRADEDYLGLIELHETELIHFIKEIENHMHNQSYFDLGELLQFELIPLLDTICKGVSEIVPDIE